MAKIAKVASTHQRMKTCKHQTGTDSVFRALCEKWLSVPRVPRRFVSQSTLTGMKIAGFFLDISTTCAYSHVMYGLAWPGNSCTTRRSPVCR